MTFRYCLSTLAVAFACFSTLACGPSEADREQMKKKMALETARADILIKHMKDCKTLETELVAFGTKNKAELKATDDWWVALGDSAKDTLIEDNRAEWDQQSKGMFAAASCPDAFKKGMKAGM